MSQKQHWKQTYIPIWIGQFFSLVSSAAVNFAVIIWLSLEHRSPEILAFAAIAGLLPQAIIGPFAGVFIDRWNRKKVMIFSDAFIALCTLAMVFVFQKEEVNLLFIYFLLACRSIGSAFHAPEMQAIAPLIVPEEKLLRVSGINQMLQSVSSVAGPALGTLAISYMPLSQVFFLDIFGAAIAIISLFFVTIPHIKTAKVSSSIRIVFNELQDGFSAIYKNKGLYALFIYAMLCTFFVMPVAIMFPLLTTEYYQGGKWEMSVVEILWGVGMLVGGGLLSVITLKSSKISLINAMYIILGLTFALSGYIPEKWFVTYAVLTLVGGVSMAIFNASFMTVIQREVNPEKLGRVFSLYFSFSLLPSIIGLLFTGYIAEHIGIAYSFIAAGILVVLIGLFSFVTPAVIELSKRS